MAVQSGESSTFEFISTVSARPYPWFHAAERVDAVDVHALAWLLFANGSMPPTFWEDRAGDDNEKLH